MTTIAYPDAPVPLRPDLVEAHERAWRRLASPGSWWSGAERLAIAAEVRRATDCALCRRRRASISPAATQGVHDAEPGSVLAPAVVDAVHRVVSDPARLTRALVDDLREAGLGDGHHVEMLGVVVTVYSIDQLARGLGLEPRPLPPARAGDPSGYEPPGLEADTAWVRMIGERHLGPDERDLWGAMGGNVIRALSLVPDEVRTLKDLSSAHYLPMDTVVDLHAGRDSLDRAQIELLAARVSALNECFY